MHRVDTDGHDSNTFTDGTPGLVEATVIGEDWLNDVQEELCDAIEAASITLVKGTTTQLRDAIVKLHTEIARTYLRGLAATQSVSNSNCVTGTGNGTGHGVQGTSGNSSGSYGVKGIAAGSGSGGVLGDAASAGGIGVRGLGGGGLAGVQGEADSGTNGNGVRGIGDGSGVGVKGEGVSGGVGVHATSSATNVSVLKADGYVDMSGGSAPSATTSLANHITKKNIPKVICRATITQGAGGGNFSIVADEGFNLDSTAVERINATTFRVNFGADFANTNYAITAICENASQIPVTATKAVGSCSFNFVVSNTGSTQDFDAASGTLAFSLTCYGAQ